MSKQTPCKIFLPKAFHCLRGDKPSIVPVNAAMKAVAVDTWRLAMQLCLVDEQKCLLKVR